jgi:hypothetical protein
MLGGMDTSSNSRGRGWLWLAFACILIFASIVTLTTLSRSRTITVTVGADGQAHLYGVPLGRGVFRRAVFWGLFRVSNADVHLAVPGPGNVDITNQIEILQSMAKAGWTNRQASRPNPYE